MANDESGGTTLIPWTYIIDLAEGSDVAASTIINDWETNIPSNATVQTDHGGVCIDDDTAVIVSTRNNPDFADMEAFGYCATIIELTEISSRGTSDFEPPVSLGSGFGLVE